MIKQMAFSCAYENYDVNFAKFPLQIRNALYCCNHEGELANFKFDLLGPFFMKVGDPRKVR